MIRALKPFGPTFWRRANPMRRARRKTSLCGSTWRSVLCFRSWNGRSRKQNPEIRVRPPARAWPESKRISRIDRAPVRLLFHQNHVAGLAVSTFRRSAEIDFEQIRRSSGDQLDGPLCPVDRFQAEGLRAAGADVSGELKTQGPDGLVRGGPEARVRGPAQTSVRFLDGNLNDLRLAAVIETIR